MIGEKSVTVDDPISFRQAQFAVLQQAEGVMLRSTSIHYKLSIRAGHRLGWVKNIRRNLSTGYDAVHLE
jgi:hypothetical protein